MEWLPIGSRLRPQCPQTGRRCRPLPHRRHQRRPPAGCCHHRPAAFTRHHRSTCCSTLASTTSSSWASSWRRSNTATTPSTRAFAPWSPTPTVAFSCFPTSTTSTLCRTVRGLGTPSSQGHVCQSGAGRDSQRPQRPSHPRCHAVVHAAPAVHADHPPHRRCRLQDQGAAGWAGCHEHHGLILCSWC